MQCTNHGDNILDTLWCIVRWTIYYLVSIELSWPVKRTNHQIFFQIFIKTVLQGMPQDHSPPQRLSVQRRAYCCEAAACETELSDSLCGGESLKAMLKLPKLFKGSSILSMSWKPSIDLVSLIIICSWS